MTKINCLSQTDDKKLLSAPIPIFYLILSGPLHLTQSKNSLIVSTPAETMTRFSKLGQMFHNTELTKIARCDCLKSKCVKLYLFFEPLITFTTGKKILTKQIIRKMYTVDF